MEQEAREILKSALSTAETTINLGEEIRKIFAPLGGVDLKIPPREPIPESKIK
jgi:plasmid stability protein